jgi:circadian clock protein KaiC
MAISEGNLIKTGISGLDSILLGGIPRTNVILAQGVTGSGKTLMGMEFIYRGIVEFGEPGLVVVFETTPDKLIRDALGFGWHLEELQQQKKLQIIFTSPEVFGKELLSPDSLLLETASEMGAQRIFVDGIGLLVSGRAVRNSIRGQYRGLLQRLIESLNRENLTAMLSLEVGAAPDTVAIKEQVNPTAKIFSPLLPQRRWFL